MTILILAGFKTLKYCPEYPKKGFTSLDHAQTWVDKFVHWYNHKHFHSGIKFVTPNDRHEGKDREILKNRENVYKSAKAKTPNRWSKGTRNWDLENEVYLNHLPKNKESNIKIAS